MGAAEHDFNLILCQFSVKVTQPKLFCPVVKEETREISGCSQLPGKNQQFSHSIAIIVRKELKVQCLEDLQQHVPFISITCVVTSYT